MVAPSQKTRGKGALRPAELTAEDATRIVQIPGPSSLEDVTVAQVSHLDEIMGAAKIEREMGTYPVARRGVVALLKLLLAPENEGAPVDKVLADSFIAQIDEKVSRQMDVILHDVHFRKLEAAWRGLRFTVDRTDFRENTKIELLNVSKEDLTVDFQEAPEIVKSGLHKLAYTAEYGTFGGQPYAAIFSNYEFGPGPQDVQLLAQCASVAAMCHAPFFAAAAPQFFGGKDFTTLPTLLDLAAIFEAPQYLKWQTFRDSEDSRYVGLLVPRFLLRLPYDDRALPTLAFHYEEDVRGDPEAYCWGNAAYAFATRLADSFAKYRWCLNIIGPHAGGTVERLAVHPYAATGLLEARCPTDVIVSERREFELSKEGFIALTFRKDTGGACFLSANSTQKPKLFGQSAEGKESELNYRLGTQLPYMFMVCRLAHYLKILQREQLGTWKSRLDLQGELNKWVDQYVADMDAVSPAVRSMKPLRQAQISVEEVPGKAGWYKVDMKVRPHFKYMGAFFTLSLVGKLDKR